MKKWTLALLTIILCTGVTAQEENPDTLIRKAFESIKKEDKTAFLRLFPDYKQFQVLIKEILGKGSDNTEQKNFQMTEEAFQAQFMPQIEAIFTTCVHQLNERGIKPSQMNWISANYSGAEKGTEAGHKRLEGSIRFKHDSAHYVLPFGEIVWSEHYKGFFGIDLKRVRTQWEPEHEFDEIDSVAVKDVTIEQQEEMVPPPPPPPRNPPPVKKPVVKQPAKKPSGKRPNG